MEDFKNFLEKSLLESKNKNILDLFVIFGEKLTEIFRIIFFGTKIFFKVIYLFFITNLKQ